MMKLNWQLGGNSLKLNEELSVKIMEIRYIIRPDFSTLFLIN